MKTSFLFIRIAAPSVQGSPELSLSCLCDEGENNKAATVFQIRNISPDQGRKSMLNVNIRIMS